MSFSQSKLIRRSLCLLLGLCFVWMLFSAYCLTGHAARSASTSSSIVCKLSQGAKVTILSDTTGSDGMKWYNVYFAYGGDAKEGFVRADLITVAGQASGGSSAGSSASANSSLRSVKPNAAIVRSYPSTSADIRTRLYKGTIVTVTSENKADDGRKWSKVSYIESGSTKEGYIRSDLLGTAPAGATMTSSSGSSTPAGTAKYINTNVALVRTYASTNGDIRTRLPRGTNVTVIKTVTGQDDNRTWHKVSYNSNGVSGEGYIRGDLLADVSSGNASTSGGSSSSSAGGSKATVIPAVANIRTYASTNGDIRSKLSQGTEVTIISEKTGDDGRKWYKISYTFNGAGMEGYIRSDLLKMGGSSSGNTNSNSGSSGNSGSSSSGGVAQVMSYASPYADVRTTLANGTKVSIIKEVNGEDGEKWTKISFTQDGKRVEGYVRSSILK